MHGQFVWYELTTSDPAAALKFYPAITGWGTDEFDQMQYTMWTSNNVPLGGVQALEPTERSRGTPSRWIPYVSVTNVDDVVRRISSLGGSLHHGPQDIPGTGRFAIVQDPQGAYFAVYKALEDSGGFDGTRRPGQFVWHELMTSDLNAAFSFYHDVFGWDKTNAFDMGDPVGMYQMYGQRGVEYGGMFKSSGEMAHVPPFWTCYVHVKDVKKAADAATKRGGTVIQGPMEVPGGDWIAIIQDPQGAIFAVHQDPAAASAAKSSKAKAATKKKAKVRPAKKARAAKKSAHSARKSKKSAKKSAKKAPRKSSKKTARKKGKRRGR